MSSQRPLLVDAGRGLTIKYREKLLYSSVAPQQAAAQRARKTPLAEKTLIFVPSLGLGYGLSELLDRLPAGCHVLCVETDQLLMRCALSCTAVSLPRDERLTIIRSDSPEAVAQFLQDLGAWRFRRVTPLYLCRAWELDKAIYHRMLAFLESGIRAYWQNRLTLTHMARLWVRNLFTNIHGLGRQDMPAAGDLSALRTEQAVLVAGAGASLEEALAYITRRRAELFVLSVDTALPVLLDAGILPDAVFMLESQQANLQDFLPYPGVSVPLICDLTANPQIIRHLGANGLYFYSSCFYPLSLFERLRSRCLLPAPLPPLGSVGVAAVSAALRITGGPVLLTGLDFSYLDGKTHARGAALNRAMCHGAHRYRPAGMLSFEAVRTRPLLRLPGKCGRLVLSDLVLQSYALKLQEILAGSGRVFDLSARGLPTGARLLTPASERGGKPAEVPAAGAAAFPPHAATFSPTSEAVRAFLAGEEKMLATAVTLCRAALSNADESGLPAPALSEKLKLVEYAYLDFPDFTPEPRLTAELLVRLPPALEDIRRRLAAFQRV